MQKVNVSYNNFITIFNKMQIPENISKIGHFFNFFKIFVKFAVCRLDFIAILLDIDMYE